MHSKTAAAEPILKLQLPTILFHTQSSGFYFPSEWNDFSCSFSSALTSARPDLCAPSVSPPLGERRSSLCHSHMQHLCKYLLQSKRFFYSSRNEQRVWKGIEPPCTPTVTWSGAGGGFSCSQSHTSGGLGNVASIWWSVEDKHLYSENSNIWYYALFFIWSVTVLTVYTASESIPPARY